MSLTGIQGVVKFGLNMAILHTGNYLFVLIYYFLGFDEIILGKIWYDIESCKPDCFLTFYQPHW